MCNTLHRKQKIEEREPQSKLRVNSGHAEEWAVLAPRVAPVMLLLFQTRSRMIKGSGIDYDKRNISVVIYDTDIP